jgi:hypothetical protein
MSLTRSGKSAAQDVGALLSPWVGLFVKSKSRSVDNDLSTIMTDSAPFDPPLVWMLLPPAILDQLVREGGPNAVALSPNLTEPITARLADGSPHSEMLWQISREIIKHLESGARGWGYGHPTPRTCSPSGSCWASGLKIRRIY